MASSGLLSTLKQASASLIHVKSAPKDTAAPHIQPYVTGLRGIAVVQSLLWLYFKTFLPAAVLQTRGPTWQHVLRDVFCAPFWNESFIFAFFLILSARTCCLPFLNNPCSATYAGSLMRRPIRVGLTISVATALALLIFSQIGRDYFSDFLSLVPTSGLEVPQKPSTPLAGFLSIYDLLWVTRNWADQAANSFFPGGTMFAPSLIYYQSYTVYIMMVILPFTRPLWHIEGLLLFGFGSFWLESWAWYSATGLLLADLAINPKLKEYFKTGVKITDNFALPLWLPAVASLIAGLVQKYLWVAAFPHAINGELHLHLTFVTSDATTVSNFDTTQPFPRVDDWLVIVGFMILVESLEPLQKLLASKPMAYLGDRSLSIFTAQSLIYYTMGVKMFISLVTTHGLSNSGAAAAVFFACVPVILIGAEIFHRCIDVPARWIARQFFVWIKE